MRIMGNELIKILYIDDEKAALFNFEQLFNDDFEVYTAISATAGMEILAKTDIQIIIADQRMPDKTGIEFLAEVALLYPDTVRILLTAYSEASVIIDAINRGQVYHYITKPFETKNVKNILDKAAQNWQLKKDNEALIVELQSKNEEYVAINEELRETNKELFDGRKRIEELVERLSLSQKVSRAGTWDWDIQNNNFFWSAEFLLIFGMEPDTVPGFESWTKSLHPDDIELASKRIQDAIAQKTDLLQHYRIVLPNGNLRWIMSTGKTTYHNDIPIRMTGLCMDITQQKQAEDKVIASQAELKKALEIANQSRQTLLSVLEDQREAEKEIQKLNSVLELRVIERTAQLEASNKELEAFSYSVSHDLRAPLRHINGFVDLLSNQFKDELPDKAHHYLDTISGASRQMGTLIDELLQYSRTGRQEVRKTQLDMNLLVKEVTCQLMTGLEEREINWDFQKLPKVSGDIVLLKQVWANLLDNAVKYTRNQQTAKISVSCREETKSFVFCVSDNGVGFDMKYAHKLFGVFQRLHSQAEFEGTGIGLANVQRIIHKHLGRVWAEAEPGKGAKFYFSLPKYQEEKS